ncbi:MAG: hypothetical protein ACJAR2_002770 [Ilumatobacter sp.]|jgi:hypothetical protein
MSKAVNDRTGSEHHRGEVSEFLDPQWRRGNTCVAVPLGEHENVVVLGPGNSEELVATERLAQQNPVSARTTELDCCHDNTLAENPGLVKSR